MLYSVAKFLFDEARILLGAGIGEDEYGNDLGFPGELEDIPEDTDAFRWANGAIRIIRYLAAQLGPAIEEFHTAVAIARRESRALGDITNIFDEELE